MTRISHDPRPEGFAFSESNSDEAWLEVEHPDEMIDATQRLSKNCKIREQYGKAAHAVG